MSERLPAWRRFLRHVSWPYTEHGGKAPAHMHVPDGHHVRLSLPWHGPASWDDMHEYVTAVIMDNLVPSAERAGWGGMTDQQQAERFARGILLSLCHRLKIEPVGAFTPKDDDDD